MLGDSRAKVLMASRDIGMLKLTESHLLPIKTRNAPEDAALQDNLR